MSKHERMARIEGIDLDTGTFSMTLATEGEASDGDILSIKGGQIPERMPMLTSHWNDPSAQLGSITNPEKLPGCALGGEGVSAEIRRDLAHMIDKGHVTGVSIRWDDVPGKSIRRVNLPSDHQYFVDEATETDHRKRYGLYFEEWRAMEGSVVALGADPEALIGRADETDGAVSTFWRAMAVDAGSGVAETGERVDDIEDEGVDPEARIAASLSALRAEAAFCHGIGASHADMINAVVDDGDADVEAVEIEGHVVFMPEPAAEALRERLEPEPEAEEPVSPDEMAHLLERLGALEAAQVTAPDEDRVSEEPVPSPTEEREEAAPLSALSPEVQALVLRGKRGERFSPVKVAELIRKRITEEREGAAVRFFEAIEKERGRIPHER